MSVHSANPEWSCGSRHLGKMMFHGNNQKDYILDRFVHVDMLEATNKPVEGLTTMPRLSLIYPRYGRGFT